MLLGFSSWWLFLGRWGFEFYSIPLQKRAWRISHLPKPLTQDNDLSPHRLHLHLNNLNLNHIKLNVVIKSDWLIMLGINYSFQYIQIFLSFLLCSLFVLSLFMWTLKSLSLVRTLLTKWRYHAIIIILDTLHRLLYMLNTFSLLIIKVKYCFIFSLNSAIDFTFFQVLITR